MQVRSAVPDDLAAIVSFDPVARTDDSRVGFLRESIDSGACLVEADDVLGYAVLNHSFYGQAFVALLFVREDSRRNGVGTALLREAEARCRTTKLFTSTNGSNEPMQRLLASLGYVRSGVIENLDPRDPELVYVRFLGGHAV